MNTKFKILIAVIFAFFSMSKSFAKENKSTDLEESNRKLAVYCMEILENRPDLAISERINILRNECYSENFTEHAPNIEDGREALFSIFENRYKKYPKLSMSIKRTAADGDLVWIHLHVKRTPESLGAAGVHIFRIQDGRIVEHWGVNQPVPKTSKNNNTMF